jgi:DNA-binding CsgD family transcriptional regulator
MTTRARAREQILQLCEGGADARTLRLEVLAVLRRVIGFDAYVWLVTDPETSVGSAPLADVPCLPELPRLIRLKYLTSVNRWTSMITPVASLHQATGGELARSLIWRDLLCRYQVGDIATSVYRDRFGCWAFLDLWRMQNDSPFTAAELEFPHGIAGPLTTALRHSQAAAFAVARAGEQPSTGPVVVLLSPALEVRAQTPQTQRYLRLLVPPDTAAQPPVPAGAYNVGAQLLAREAGVDGNPPLARVHLGSGHWLTLSADRLGGAQPVSERDIAVSIETTASGGRLSLFTRACGLSSRESELLGHVAAGAATRDIAQLMFVSEHTVQDHLKSIFTKTDTRTRRALGKDGSDAVRVLDPPLGQAQGSVTVPDARNRGRGQPDVLGGRPEAGSRSSSGPWPGRPHARIPRGIPARGGRPTPNPPAGRTSGSLPGP